MKINVSQLDMEAISKEVSKSIPSQKSIVGEETLIGEWVEDGVTYDLCRKVVNIGNLPNSASANYPHGITNKIKFVHIYGVGVADNVLPIPNATGANNTNIYLAVGNKSITITTGSDRSKFVGYITLEFIREKQRG